MGQGLGLGLGPGLDNYLNLIFLNLNVSFYFPRNVREYYDVFYDDRMYGQVWNMVMRTPGSETNISLIVV